MPIRKLLKHEHFQIFPYIHDKIFEEFTMVNNTTYNLELKVYLEKKDLL